jgi:hypothetical protein
MDTISRGVNDDEITEKDVRSQFAGNLVITIVPDNTTVAVIARSEAVRGVDICH